MTGIVHKLPRSMPIPLDCYRHLVLMAASHWPCCCQRDVNCLSLINTVTGPSLNEDLFILLGIYPDYRLAFIYPCPLRYSFSPLIIIDCSLSGSRFLKHQSLASASIHDRFICCWFPTIAHFPLFYLFQSPFSLPVLRPTMLKRALTIRAPVLKRAWVSAVPRTAAVSTRSFYIRTDGEADGDTRLATSQLDALERDLGRIKHQLSAVTSNDGSLQAETSRIRRAHDMLVDALRDLEALVPEEFMQSNASSATIAATTTTSTAAGTPRSGQDFSPTFHSPHGAAYSPLETSATTTTTVFEQVLTEPVQAFVGGTGTGEARGIRPEIHVSMARQPQGDSAVSAAAAGGYHAYTPRPAHDPAAPHFVSGEANLAADASASEQQQRPSTNGASATSAPQGYLDVTSEPELESLWAREAADMASGQSFEPTISGAGSSTVESLHGYHHAV